MIWVVELAFFLNVVSASTDLNTISSPAPSLSPLPQSQSKNDEAVKEKKLVLVELLKARDPFKRVESALKREMRKAVLESYSLDAFTLVAILTGPVRMRAMVLAPDGKTYFIAEKMRMGTRGGVVRKITQDSVWVREKTMNVLGEEENADTEVLLKKDLKNANNQELEKKL